MQNLDELANTMPVLKEAITGAVYFGVGLGISAYTAYKTNIRNAMEAAEKVNKMNLICGMETYFDKPVLTSKESFERRKFAFGLILERAEQDLIVTERKLKAKTTDTAVAPAAMSAAYLILFQKSNLVDYAVGISSAIAGSYVGTKLVNRLMRSYTRRIFEEEAIRIFNNNVSKINENPLLEEEIKFYESDLHKNQAPAGQGATHV